MLLTGVGGWRAALASLTVALVLGLAGGLAAGVAGLPVPLLLGSITVTAVVALTGWRPLRRTPKVPRPVRALAMSVIGASIGGTVSPQILAQVDDWAVPILTLFVFLPVTHAAGYILFSRGGIPRAEAWFGSIPGGLIESVQMAEDAGVETRTITVLQFLRLILTVMAVPVIFTLVTGHAVGSAAGMELPGAAGAGLSGAVGIVCLGALGAWAAARLRLPAAPMLGPLLLSAFSHAAGMPMPHPPGWLFGLTQVVIGCSLGAQFAGIPRLAMVRAAGLAASNTVLSLTIALLFALALHAATGQALSAVFLAYAPGGLAEMSLVAMSLHIDLLFIAAHHLIRIILAATTARIGAAWLIRHPPAPDPVSRD